MSEQTRDPEKILLRLEWTVIRRLDGLLHGDYRSLFRGFGVDLADLREYQFHDDVRHIDWNVTARLQTPYVRVYNEDRDVTAWFLLDLSPSVSFGSEQVEKRSVAIEFVTVLARLLSRHGNPVGALFYIDRFQLQRATAIGSGILMSLKAIFPDAEFDLRSWNPRRDSTASAPLDQAAKPEKPAFKPVPPGSYTSAVIILLSDGQSNVGPDPIESVRIAAERGVRVYTVGFGTTEGEIIRFEGWSMRVRLDEQTLTKIAELTQGEYYYAGSAAELKKVYQTLSSRLVFVTRETEITVLFSAAAGVLALLAGLLSVWWFSRIL